MPDNRLISANKESAMRRHVRQVLVILGLLLLAPALSGCIVEEGHRCGYWHHC